MGNTLYVLDFSLVISGNSYKLPSLCSIMLKLTILLAVATLGFAQDDNEILQNKEDGNVTTLNLSGQGITSLDEYDFSKYRHLEELDLSDNDIQYIKEDVLMDNTKLKKLNLSGNKNLQLPEFSTLLISNLQELSLSNCNIEEVPSNLFDGLLEMKIVDLSENPLHENALDVSTISALLSPQKVILPHIDELMIKTICDDFDITIGIKSQDYSDSIECADVRAGSWRPTLKEEPSQNQPDSQANNSDEDQVVDEGIRLDGEKHLDEDLQPEAENDDQFNFEGGSFIEKKRQVNPDDQKIDDGADGNAAAEEAHQNDEPEPENTDNIAPADSLLNNDTQPEAAAENENNAEGGEENKDNNEGESPPATDDAADPKPAPDNETNAEGGEPSAPENEADIVPEAENQDNPEPAASENDNNAEPNNPVPEASPPEPEANAEAEPETNDNIEPQPAAENENNAEAEAENKDNPEPLPENENNEPNIALGAPETAENGNNDTINEAKPEDTENKEVPNADAATPNEVNPEDSLPQPEINAPDAVDGRIAPDAVDGKEAAGNGNQEEKATDGEKQNEPFVRQRAVISSPENAENNESRSANIEKADNAGDQTKAAESSKPSTGSTVLVVLVIAVIVAGAAAFGYKFYKSRTYQAARSTEPAARELKEIVVDKTTNGASNPRSQTEEEPLMERLANSVEIKEIDETSESHSKAAKNDTPRTNEGATSSSNNSGPQSGPVKPPHVNRDEDPTQI